MRTVFFILGLFLAVQPTNSAFAYQSIRANPSWINFGDHKINTSSFNQTINVFNTGNETIPFIQTSVFGQNSQFRIFNTCGQLMPYQSCIIYVNFDPSVIGHAMITINIYGGSAFDSVNADGNGIN